MPTYEMPLLLKIATKPELKTILKRTAETIFKKGGFIRKIDNLGKLQTPNKISANNMVHKEANYFIFHFDIPPAEMHSFQNELGRDVDIIKSCIYNKNNTKKVQCTLHDELLPPPYRPAVLEMLKIGRKQKAHSLSEKFKFKYNSGLDYYPFQR